ncbi:DUF418 domain-containing protein [Streptomyces sp. A1-5]|uniref:DUF418 domain-containing protein n=1 Tax=Streptomyces sp. A1-5 TaxID=2738410 RepID=UPI001F15FF96|nr:DUF418 domain-containing protein [Streptomyces sp. A1-5]UJB40627.1 DUF418 domain-containing protein [Streptomyces sp. A1-5]
MQPTTATAPPAPARPPGPAARRIRALDALRGFALCGILLVNIPQITAMAFGPRPGELHPVRAFLDLAVQERFFPIFSFLFGISFALFLDGAARRSDRPRLLLVRRLIALGLLGAAHQLLHPGEALTPYAIFGLLVLLPATWLPTPLVLAAGGGLTLASVTLASGGLVTIPGLFLLGLAVARLGVPRALEQRTGTLVAVLAVAAPAAAAALWWQYATDPADAHATRIAAAAGLLAAVAYAVTLLLLLRTPLGTALSAVLEPLGRMALTNYLAATLLVVAAAPLLDLRHSLRWGTAMVLALVILALQTLFSRWWLARFRYGPAEWCLRTVTWWERVPNRR